MIEPTDCGICGAQIYEVTLIYQSLLKVLVNVTPTRWPEGRIRISNHQPNPEAILGERIKSAGDAFAASLHPLHEKTCNKRHGRATNNTGVQR